MIWIQLIIETAIACCLLICALLFMIRNGAVNALHFYPENVQQRVYEMGLTTPEKVKKRGKMFKLAAIPVYILYAFLCVKVINGANTFWPAFGQTLFIFEIYNLFDCFVVDETWVKKGKTWIIPGTEDLLDVYIPFEVQVKKRVSAALLFGIVSALLAFLMTV